MRYALSQLPDHVLRRELSALAARDCATTADLIAHIAEFDVRRLHAPAGYPSTFAYCVHELRMSEDMAVKRIRVGRVARRFPCILPALADGSLHLSGLFLLSNFLTESTSAELLEAARNKTKAQIELLLAQHFPQADVPTRIEPIYANTSTAPAGHMGGREPATGACEAASRTQDEEPPAQVSLAAPEEPATSASAATPLQPVVIPNPQLPVPGQVAQAIPPAPRPLVKPLAPQRYALQVTLDQEAHDLLREAQDLEGHAIPAGDICELLKRSLRSHVIALKRAKCAVTSKPRSSTRRVSANPRHVPAAIKRAVRARDGNQCTFASGEGHRCTERRGLEFDHIQPVARGGQTAVEGIRLRCRAHNQLEAERLFGAAFMQSKREMARQAAESKQAERARRRSAACPESQPTSGRLSSNGPDMSGAPAAT